MKYKKIETIQALKDACLSNKGSAEFFIALGGGLLRSSKNIFYDADENLFAVNNEIDDTYQDDLTEEGLRSETNIVEAIENGAFYQYLWD